MQSAIRTKTLLIIGFTLSLIMCLILGGIALSYMYTTQSRIIAIVETHNVKTTLLQEMFTSARERSLLLHMMLDVGDPFVRDDLYLDFSWYGSRFVKARIKLSDMKLNQEERLLLDKQGQRSDNAVSWQRKIVDLIQIEHFTEAKKLLTSKAVPAQNEVLKVLNDFRRYQETAARKLASHNDEDLKKILVYTIILGVMASLIVIGIAFITTRRALQTEKDLLFEKRFAEATLHSIGEAVITTDLNRNILYINPVAEILTGWNNDEAIGSSLLEVLCLYGVDESFKEVDPILRAIATDGIYYSTPYIKLRSKYNQHHAIDYSAAPIRDQLGEISGGILVFRDVTEVRSLTAQLNYQASHDTLTGLVNRHEFELRLGRVLTAVRAEQGNHALFYMDLDQFKIINDTCGHAAGDELLKQLATNLKSCLRERDTLARLGGDEFGVILDNCSLSKAKEIAEKLRATAKDLRFSWENKQFEVGISIGVVPINSFSENLSDLMSAADTACFEAKDQGRNRVHMYDPKDINLMRREGEMQWVHRINDALEKELFILYCQPVLALNDRKNSDPQYEVLLRLREPSDKLVPPNAFIPAAERYGLMVNIDRYVIRKTIEYLQQLNNSSVKPVIAINISGQSVSDDAFHLFILEILQETGIDPTRLTFEITETATIANFSQATRLISSLKEKGCQFALDDFGSGLSSFSYLKNIPVDYLKIDGSFIRDITTDKTDYAFVEAINQIGSIMGIKTIAEFVESEDTLLALNKIGIDFAQGFHIGRPIPMEDCLQSRNKVKSG